MVLGIENMLSRPCLSSRKEGHHTHILSVCFSMGPWAFRNALFPWQVLRDDCHIFGVNAPNTWSSLGPSDSSPPARNISQSSTSSKNDGSTKRNLRENSYRSLKLQLSKGHRGQRMGPSKSDKPRDGQSGLETKAWE